MKTYVLKIRYNPDTEEVESIYEYLEQDEMSFEIGDETIEVSEEMAKYIDGSVLGLAQEIKPLAGFEAKI